MNRFVLKHLLIVLLSAFLAMPVAAAEPVKIGVTLGLTGKYSEMSDMQMKGFRLWERDVNSRGGILGRQVRPEGSFIWRRLKRLA